MVISASLAAFGMPLAQAQMLGDTGLRSALTSSLLQTTQQKHQRRISKDPYMALIEQSDPNRRLRALTSSADPLSPSAQVMSSRMALSGQLAAAGGVGALGSALSMQGSALLSQPGMGVGKLGGMGLLPSMLGGIGAASLAPVSILNMSGAACAMPLPGGAVALPGSGSCR